MRFIAKRSDLLDALSLVTKVSDEKSPMDVLSKVKFETSKGQLTLSCTNLVVEQKLSFPISIQKEGGFAVNAKMIYGIIKNMYSDDVEFNVDDEKYWVHIKSGKVKAKIAASSVDEFPDFSEVGKDVETISLPVEKITVLIDFTSFCMLHDEGRPHLNCMLLELENNTLRGVCTDGHRLSLYELPVENKKDMRYQIPERGLKVIQHLLSMRGEEISLGKYGNMVLFRREVSLGKHDDNDMIDQMMDIVVLIKESDGRFPPYDNVIPKEFTKKCIVPQKLFHDSLKRAMFIVKGDKQNYVKFEFLNGEDLSISGEDLSIGGIKDIIPVQFDCKEDFTIGFNGSYLLDFINSLSDTKNVLLFFNGETDACKVSSEEDLENFTGIIMPIRM